MLETENQEFIEPEYPSFPVVFQRDLDVELDPSPITNVNSRKKAIGVSEHDAHILFGLTQQSFTTKYPQFFMEKLETEKIGIEKFFREYCPIDELFIQEMKKNIQCLKIARLGANKIYIGEIVDGKCNGKSIIIFKNGNLYEGEMLNNKRHGKGVFVHVNLGYYRGEFKEDLKHGNGIEILYNKNAYRGNFVNGLRHDRGLYIDQNNNIYEGEWKLGIMHGRGVLKTEKSTYCGSFVNWLKHGNGEEHFSNGDIHIGEYQNGRFDGVGTYEWKLDGAVYEGNFKNGLRHGKGKWQKNQTKYNGGYSEGLKQGYGEMYFPSGNFYKGNFIQDKKEGYGEMFWTDSSFYKGEWKGGIQHGKGQIYLAGGDIISGIFQNSILVQAMPSMYEKQTEISNMSIQDLFGSKQKIEQSTRNRTHSQSKGFIGRKKLTKIEENSKKKGVANIHGKMYFKSPEKSEHSDGGAHRECKCAKRQQNFRLKQHRNPRRPAHDSQNHSHSKQYN